MAQTQSPPFQKILVANRGEIAARVFRTCRQHGISTVAVYSDADADALHVAAADEAVHIGPTPSAQSYLVVDRIIAAAKQTGAQAIHPGYGFLSERPALVEACKAAGITFIGPNVHAMEVMGDKVASRRAMVEAGVPVVPGRDDLDSAQEAGLAAAEIGFPVMLKASAGGGGKGMRIVHAPGDLERAFDGARREAVAAFGDGRIFIERAVMQARHIEIQVLADGHGNAVHLNERDCSVQRRHQKVIEEAPSPAKQMNADIRAAMGDVAVRAAQAVSYIGAGTVEFLFEETPDGPQFYFLEMNTRLQVEHPVTEAITGRDLVWDQIRIAAGETLGFTQEQVPLAGHALECRIYAEDSVRFLPSPGLLKVLRWPQGEGIRVDSAVFEGSEVSSHYDPMIAKVTTHGATRSQAIARMREALRQTVCLGIETNIAFHLEVLREKDFLAGELTTRYIDTHPALTQARTPTIEQARAIAAAAAVVRAQAIAGGGQGDRVVGAASESGVGAWRRAVRWRT